MTTTSTSKGDWNPGEKYTTLLHHIKEILDGGEKRTVRDVYYALESRGHKYEYRYVKRAVKKGRRAGYIDPAQIIDSSRQAAYTPSDGYDDPQSFLEERIRGVWKSYWEDIWRYQDNYVEVWLEKQSLATVFQPICSDYYVRLEATRGDWSDSKVYEAAKRLKQKLVNGNDVKILYFGDFNPSGYHAPVSILDTLEYYGIPLEREFPGSGDSRYYDPEHGSPFGWKEDDVGELEFERCGINLEHIERFDLTENPVPSGSDKDSTIKSHFRTFVSGGRDTNVELNALKEFERDFLESLIEEKIRETIDDQRWNAAEKRISNGRRALESSVNINDDGLAEEFDPVLDEGGSLKNE